MKSSTQLYSLFFVTVLINTLALNAISRPMPKSGHFDASPVSSSGFNGINWADGRDNFVDGWIIPSGIDHRASASEIANQTQTIALQFKSLLKVNTIRLGVNPATVRDSRWWPKYKALIRQADSLKFKVILACWESKSSKDGRVDNLQEFEQMWDHVLKDFSENEDVYFEIFNEPHGYTSKDWRDLAAAWIAKHESRIKGGDRSRILVSGTGYSEYISPIARDKRFDGCRLSFHLYPWFGGKHRTRSGWEQELEKRIDRADARRTIMTEWGARMKTLPHNFYTEELPDNNTNRAYILAMSQIIRDWRMGTVYWPGLRDGDDFSLLEREEKTSSLKITNESGKDRLLISFGCRKYPENSGRQ